MGPLRCQHAVLKAFTLSFVPDVRPEQHGTSPSEKKTVCSNQGVDVECPRFRSSASERS